MKQRIKKILNILLERTLYIDLSCVINDAFSLIYYNKFLFFARKKRLERND